MGSRQRFSRVLGVVAFAALLGACDDGVVAETDAFMACGDGIVGAAEQCDDGNNVDGDGCTALCRFETGPLCGDSTVNGLEECDDGNVDDGDGCSSTCTSETAPACGDGTVDAGEDCDDGNTADGDGCAADCTDEVVAPACGDGTVDDGEECDDGNTDDGDGCAADCTDEVVAPACGDGTVDDGEECDDGNTDAGDGCDADCALEVAPPACGDGNVDDGEECDDGNTDAGDGCDADCALEAVCGDGNLEGDEACDDGNIDDGDGCAADCTFEPAVCGDAILQNGEECDDGNVDAVDGCSAACLVEVECIIVDDCAANEVCARGYCLDEMPPVVCGDTLVEGDEECDDGNLDIGDGCDDQCVIELPDPICGNGIVEAGELCDDGNLDIDDGCNADCLIEGCGNGLIEAGEECDDANLDAGDGCDANCAIEIFCGDGVLNGDEQCDDGNLDAGDGCDAACLIEAGCGNGIVDAGETCDDGNVLPGDGCDIACQIEDGVAFPLAPLDACVQVGGDLDDMDPVWDRPGVFGNECAPGNGDDHFLETFRFTNNTADPQFINAQAAWGGDGYLHIFQDPFAADMLGMGCIAGDDDFPNTTGSRVEGVLIAPGQTIVVIASTFGENAAIGPYTVEVCTVPPPARCGDGIVHEDNGEECDDGNVDAGDGCDDRCQREPVCGDGFIDGLEECDDGNVDPADGCDALCQREPVCGDLLVDEPEQCDDGNVDAGDGCSDVCLFESECGNGLVEGLEQCDDGNVDVGDGCDAACAVDQPDALDIAERGATIGIEGALEEGDFTWNRPSAGCGFASPDRVYDFYRVTNNTGADQQLTVTGAWGGDSYLHIFRDPFNPADPGGCVIGNDDFGGLLGSQVRDVEIAAGETLVIVASSFGANAFTGPYTIEVLTQTLCGDGVAQGVEACDDGNLDNGDGCTDTCLIEATCGDGELGLGEECDDGNVDAGDGCDAVCVIERVCGNGLLTDDEECDDGNVDNGDGCDETCAIEPFCGDGTLDDGEECDDGNVDAGDGCDAACAIERVCGDGLLTDDEACDDGNVDAGDGCAPDCTLEEGPLAIAPRDQAINVAGDIDDMDLVWSRPNADCSARAGDQFFETLTIVNNTGAAQSVRVTANWADDGYLFVYRTPFDPANLDNCVIGDDDFLGLAGSRIESVDIADGEQLVIVATTFGANNPIGPYGIEVYTLPVCGDGELQGEEECDDGNLDAADGCSEICVIEIAEPVCGDGNVDAGEECDDGNLDPDDGCSPVCVIEIAEPVCGDGIIEPPEQCDDGNVVDGDGCDANCANEAVCGNGIPEPGEACDDGNLDAGDGCAPDCTIEIAAAPIAPIDASIELAGSIDDQDAQWARPNANCTPTVGDDHFYEVRAIVNQTGAAQRVRVTATWAGDGYLHAFTAPFDAAVLDNCIVGDDDFIIPPNPGTLGSQIVDLEIAPDQVLIIVASTFAGGVAIGDYTLEVYTQPVCGDAAIQGAEACDDGNIDNGDGCDDQCQIEPVCGDNVVDAVLNEECDDGNIDDGDGCDSACQREPVCGDTFVDDPEQCDDGNLDAGDGCAADCSFEQVCGNGAVEGTEECDDGNLDNNDGCDAICTFEVVDLIRGLEQRQGATVQGERDDYTFTVDHTQSRLLAFTGDGAGGCPAGNDTTIGIFPVNPDGTTGERLLFDDDGGLGVCSSLDALLDAGDYLLRVQGFGGNLSALSGYTLNYSLRTDVTAGGDFDGAFVQNGSDVFNFDFAVDTDAAFETGDGAGACPGDTTMSIFPIVDGERGDRIFNDDGGVGACSRIAQVFPAGPHQVVIVGFGDRAIGDYTLQVRFAGVCGDGEINDGEECDDGNVDAGDGCNDLCQLEIVCGNGVLQDGEECDDGNIDNGDGCSDACVIEPGCGNGQIDDGEQCDDGNVDVGDGCDAACQFEQVCGNGAVEGTEECDDGNVDNDDGCDAICTNENFVFAQGVETRQSVGAAIGARDIWRFTVDHNGGSLFAETSDGNDTCADVGDTFMRLLAVNEDGTLGAELNANDDGGIGFCSQITRDADLAAGEYALIVEDLGRNNVQVAYTVALRNTLAVDAGGDFDGAFVREGNDVFTITFDADTTAAFETGDGAGGCPGDTRMNIFPIVDGARGDPIFNDDGGVGVCSLVNQAFVAGNYAVVIDGFGGGAIDAYVLSVTFAGVCGDGEVNVGEACDDGNVDNGDGCDDACQFEIFCGNGNVDDGEECDDGNADAGDGCDATCQREPVCGDGFVDDPEACDDGNVNPDDGCDAACQFEQVCGNGAVEGTEQCDDGNVDNGDGCDAVCTFEAVDLIDGLEVRANNQTARGERDDYRFTVDHTPSRLVAFTGDGQGGCAPAPNNDTTIAVFPVNPDGTTGDRLLFNDDGGVSVCSRLDAELDAGDYLIRVQGFGGVPQALAGYTLDYRLGADVSAGGDFDGAFVQDGDDLFTFSTDAASTVLLETGDGAGACPNDTRMELFRLDENGVRVERVFNDDGGVGTCSLISSDLAAGNYVVRVDGFGNRAIDAYILNVQFIVCGDGAVGGGEECDDGNVDAGDGCAADCTIEPGCGNGRIELDETCDDGNLVNGDGCDDQCQFEVFCGNGNVDAGEACDDGNLDNGDGCSALCQFEQVCGNGEVEGTEQCDDGNLDNGDGCDALCTFEVVALPLGREVRDGATVLGERDDYTFTVDHTQARVVAFTGDGEGGCPAGNDTTIAIFPVNADGTTGDQLFFNDDGGAGLCSRVDELLDAGDYLIRVQGFGAPNPAALPGYTLDYRQTVNVAAGGDFDGAFVQSGNDLFGFTVDADTTGTFETSDGAGACPNDTRMAIFPVVDGVRGERLFFNDDGGVGTCSLLADANLPAGTYVVVVDGFGGRAIADYTLTVTFPGRCGDGNVEDPEECDDGNVVDGDGCQADCTITPGPVCGDGNVDAGEECDDGNLDNGDGCDAECSNEFFLRNQAITQQGSRMAAGSSDTFRFTLDATGRVLFLTSDGQFGCPADTRARMFLVNADGTRGDQVGGDIDGSPNPAAPECAGGLRTNLDAGTYEIEITEQADGAIAAYQIDLLVAVDAAIESSTVGAIPVGGTDGYFLQVADADTELAIFTDTAADGTCDRDTVMQVFTVGLAGQLTPLNDDDDGGEGLCSRVQQVLQPGNYAVVVNEFGNNAELNDYNLNVECISCRNAPPPRPGQLQITEIMQNPSAVADGAGEYIEVLNTGDNDVDIFGMTLGDDGADAHPVDESVIIPAGGYAVFARNGDPAANGGFDVDYVYADFFLANGDDEVVLLGWRGNELDRVNYDNGDTFPDPTGASMQFGGNADDDNADGALWCESGVAFGAGDLGTPGAANEGCDFGGGAVEVAIENFDMNPNPIVIDVGQTVRWTNLDNSTHTVTSGNPGDPNAGDAFDSGNMGQGDTFEFTFDQAGVFTYFCRPHSGFMLGYTVTVNGAPN